MSLQFFGRLNHLCCFFACLLNAAITHAVVIDDFNTGSVMFTRSSLNDPSEHTQTNLSTDHVVGGNRHLTIYTSCTIQGCVTPDMTISQQTGDSQLEVSDRIGASGFLIQYGASQSLNTDLTEGGLHDRFRLDVSSSDGEIDILAIRVSSSSPSHEGTALLSPLNSGTVEIPFDSFINRLNGGFDIAAFTDVDLI